jgi:hypothetical protein
MSSIIVINHHREFPLIIAANHDGVQSPSANGIQVLAREPNLIVGERLGENSTWLAVNKHSLFAAITNQGMRNPNLQPRGKLVIEALAANSLDELVAFVEALDTSKYSNFNLLFGNQNHVFLAQSYILTSMAIRELSPGVHLIADDIPFGQSEWTKAKYTHTMLNNGNNHPWLKYYSMLKAMLANGKYGFNHIPGKNKDGMPYTQSSSVLAFSPDGLARLKYHNRSIPRAKRKEGEPFVPRYKDYIDVWHSPDGALFGEASKAAHGNEEPEGHDVEDLEESTEGAAAGNKSPMVFTIPHWDKTPF